MNASIFYKNPGLFGDSPSSHLFLINYDTVFESSFSGINPMDNNTVSQGMISSVPRIGFKFFIYCRYFSPACTRLEPTIFVTVVLKCLRVHHFFLIQQPFLLFLLPLMLPQVLSGFVRFLILFCFLNLCIF